MVIARACERTIFSAENVHACVSNVCKTAKSAFILKLLETTGKIRVVQNVKIWCVIPIGAYAVSPRCQWLPNAHDLPPS